VGTKAASQIGGGGGGKGLGTRESGADEANKTAILDRSGESDRLQIQGGSMGEKA